MGSCHEDKGLFFYVGRYTNFGPVVSGGVGDGGGGGRSGVIYIDTGTISYR